MTESFGKSFKHLCSVASEVPPYGNSCLLVSDFSGSIIHKFCGLSCLSEYFLKAEKLTDIISESHFNKLLELSVNSFSDSLRFPLKESLRSVSDDSVFLDIKPVRLSDQTLFFTFPVIITDDPEKLNYKLSDDLSNSVILAGGIAHDFNNLLMAILGNINLAKLFSEQEGKSYARLVKAEEAALFGKHLTNQLMNFSKTQRPDRIKLNIVDLLKKTIDAISGEVNFDISLRAEEENLFVEVDEIQVAQVFVNMIRSIEKEADSDLSLIFVVRPVFRSDVPLEMPSDTDVVEINIINNSFTKDTNSLDPGIILKGGFSLGLAISDLVLRANKSRLVVHDLFENGFLSTIYLPLCSAPLQESPEKKTDSKKPRIIVMDDSELVREVAGYMLGLLGYQVDFANDGDSALRKISEALAENNPFAYAILDLNVTNGKGAMDVIGDIISLDPGIKAILSSGFVSDPSTGDYMNRGFMGVIPKPYQIDELERILKRVKKMKPFSLNRGSD